MPYFDDEFTEDEKRVARDADGKTVYVEDMSYGEWKEKYVDNSGGSGIMESGARITNALSKEAEEFANLYYEEIRHFSTDCKRIASNLGMDESDIRKIKAYLFEDNSLYDEYTQTWKRFDPDCAIAQSWQRLMVGKNIQPHDRTLINHELYEMEIKKKNPTISHDEAHRMASKKYNYSKESDKYYANLKKNKKNE